MKSEKLIYLPYNPTEETEVKNVRSILAGYIYHWPMFLLCMALAMAVAFFYTKSLKNFHQVTAKIAIKDEKSQATSEQDAALQSLNISAKPKLIESEIEILRSRPVVGKMVNKLELWVAYSENNDLKDIDLFNNSPIKFQLVKAAGPIRNTEYNVKILSPESYSFNEPNGKVLMANFGTTVNTKIGSWKLELQKDKKDWIGKEVKLQLRNPEDVISEYQAKISTIINKSAPIIDLKIIDEVPERGELVLNELIEILFSDRLRNLCKVDFVTCLKTVSQSAVHGKMRQKKKPLIALIYINLHAFAHFHIPSQHFTIHFPTDSNVLFLTITAIVLQEN